MKKASSVRGQCKSINRMAAEGKEKERGASRLYKIYLLAGA